MMDDERTNPGSKLPLPIGGFTGGGVAAGKLLLRRRGHFSHRATGCSPGLSPDCGGGLRRPREAGEAGQDAPHTHTAAAAPGSGAGPRGAAARGPG